MKRFLIGLFLILPGCGIASGLSRGAADMDRSVSQAQERLMSWQQKMDNLFAAGQQLLSGLQDFSAIMKQVDWRQLPLLLAQLPQLKLDLEAASADLKAAAPKAFAAADKNQDGKISAEEVFTYLKFGGPAALVALLGVIRQMMKTADSRTKAQLQDLLKALGDQSDSHDELAEQVQKVAKAANVTL